MEKNILRNETPADYRTVEELTKEAFWNHYTPGCNEHYLLHILRKSEKFIPKLDFVAEAEGKIVGNIVYTKCQITGDGGEMFDVITFGPVSVLPAYQEQGIGGKLIEHTKKLAKEMGYRAVLIYGDPDYYRRFGFVPAEQYSIGTADNMYAAALQAYELYEGALSECKGHFFEGSVFDIDQEAAAEFDKSFPFMEKQSGLPSQERFMQTLGMRKPRIL
jgi:predicted N-acetyltransferase YhbS